eukprot:TRINITY_DN273_c0_g1::TRINITY_DN273_c0_g1_i1::g.1673::m.1673 TRINITY_DN273_c0_g1::TRINITY_DN273_c0_g1_i1::g.1673  ORF type:complete len:142 (-),score=-46.03,CIDE-N/PF02017.10/0.25,CIDE-N/PF02017.10/2.1e+03,zf-Nse/PF11789.3/0.39,zf-Nse/PF11789.3/8.5e+02 TRINITY_DN273_c0_g1_i1:323-748(-)
MRPCRILEITQSRKHGTCCWSCQRLTRTVTSPRCSSHHYRLSECSTRSMQTPSRPYIPRRISSKGSRGLHISQMDWICLSLPTRPSALCPILSATLIIGCCMPWATMAWMPRLTSLSRTTGARGRRGVRFNCCTTLLTRHH